MTQSKKCFVALIDLLGFSDFVNTKSSDDIYALLSIFMKTPKDFNLQGFDYNINVFSDTVIISCPVENADSPNMSVEFSKFLLYINNIQMANIAFSGILPLRGGIAYGDFYTNGKDLLFGKALVDAHETECKLACYPRIIVSSDLLQPEKSKEAHQKLSLVFKDTKLADTLKNVSPFDERTFSVRRDFDGLLHCNYLSSLKMLDGGWADYTHEALIQHRRFIIANITTAKNKSIAAKYHWMKTYHNWFCQGYEDFQDKIIMDSAEI